MVSASYLAARKEAQCPSTARIHTLVTFISGCSRTATLSFFSSCSWQPSFSFCYFSHSTLSSVIPMDSVDANDRYSGPRRAILVLRFRDSNHIDASINLVLRSAHVILRRACPTWGARLEGLRASRRTATSETEPAAILRDGTASARGWRGTRAAPQDEVCGFKLHRPIRLASWNRSTRRRRQIGTDLEKAAIDHIARDIENHCKADIGNPAVPFEQPGDQARRNTHHHDREA